MAIIHLGFLLPKNSSDLPENAVRISPNFGTGNSFQAFSYLVLHHEEFACATLVTKRADVLLPHRFTHHLQKRLVYFLLHLSSFNLLKRPDVIRFAALWCSDFPLKQISSDCPICFIRQGKNILTKIVQQMKFSLNFNKTFRKITF